MFEEKEFYDKTFKNLNLKEKTLISKEFNNCVFENSILNNTILKHCKFKECLFINCDLSLLKIKNSVFNYVVIKNCKAIGIDWSFCEKPFDINFYDSNISLSSFYKQNMKCCNIISCKAHEVDFGETNLEKANFENTDLFKSVFDNTNLKLTDLSKAKNYLINPNTNYLKKTKVSKEEAYTFLCFLDLDIIE